MLKVYPWPVIYHFSDEVGFGDRWAAVNLLLKKSERTKKVQLISRKNWHEDIVEIKSHLNSKGNFKWVSEPGNHYLNHAKLYMTPYCPTHLTWTPNNNKTICYQLDGRYKWEEKNLLQNETDMLFEYLHKLGYKTIDLGGMQPIEEIIKVMAKSFAFIGVPSGISHVGCSVGIPEYIICKPTTKFMNMEFHENIVYANKQNIKLFPSVDNFLSSFHPGKPRRIISIP